MQVEHKKGMGHRIYEQLNFPGHFLLFIHIHISKTGQVVDTMLKISELQTKDVVNILDGKNLGTICDLDIDLQHGRVNAIVCPGAGKFFGLLSNGQDIVIPWRNIVKIGSDVILVRLDERPYLLEEEEKDDYPSSNGTHYRPYKHE